MKLFRFNGDNVRSICAVASKPRLNDRFGLTNCHICVSPFMVFLFLLLKSCVFLPVSGPPWAAYMNLETRVVAGATTAGPQPRASAQMNHHIMINCGRAGILCAPPTPRAHRGDDQAANRASDVDER